MAPQTDDLDDRPDPADVINEVLQDRDLVPDAGERRRINCTDLSIEHTDIADYVNKLRAWADIVEGLQALPADRRELPWAITNSDGGGPP